MVRLFFRMGGGRKGRGEVGGVEVSLAGVSLREIVNYSWKRSVDFALADRYFNELTSKNFSCHLQSAGSKGKNYFEYFHTITGSSLTVFDESDISQYKFCGNVAYTIAAIPIDSRCIRLPSSRQ